MQHVQQQGVRNLLLKVLSSDMLIYMNIQVYMNITVKREARKILEISARPSSCENPFKLQRHLVSVRQLGT